MRETLLPNGLAIRCLNDFEARVLYHQIFVQRNYLRHGVRVGDGDCVFDVGANIGVFSLFLVRSFRGLRLFAFEPVAETFAVLRANASLMEGAEVTLLDVGLSREPGEAVFTFDPSSSFTSSMYPSTNGDSARKDLARHEWIAAVVADLATLSMIPPRGAAVLRRGLAVPGLRTLAVAAVTPLALGLALRSWLTRREVRCRMETLSDVLAKQSVDRIDLLKIDVEGAETDVLDGIRDADWPRIRQIVIEVNDIDGRVDSIVRRLKERGYRTVVEPEEWEVLKLLRIFNVYAVRE